LKLCVVLRLSVLLQRSRSHKASPEVQVDAAEKSISLTFPSGWLDEHPLSQADLKVERKHLATFGIALEYR